MDVQFYELALGAKFESRGEKFTKVGMSMAHDQRSWGHIFMGHTKVVSDGPFLSAEEAAKWKPDPEWLRYWNLTEDGPVEG